MSSDSGKSGKSDSGPNVFDNFKEDLGNVLSSNAASPHSAYDVRNAEAAVKQQGGKKQDYLPGGDYGPGGKNYSPSALHEAGLAQARDDDRRARIRDFANDADAVSDAARAANARRAQNAAMMQAKDGLVSDSVGLGGRNVGQDVKTLQGALAQSGDFDLSVTGGADGYPGQRLVDGVKTFQKRSGLKVDGLVLSGGPTEAALTGLGMTARQTAFGEPRAPRDVTPQLGGIPKGNVAVSPAAEARNAQKIMAAFTPAPAPTRDLGGKGSAVNAIMKRNAPVTKSVASNPSRNLMADFAIGMSHAMKSVLPGSVNVGLKTLGVQLAEGAQNLRTGIDALTGNLAPNRDRLMRATLAAGQTDAQRNSTGGQIGTRLGQGLRFAGGFANWGLGDILAGAGEDVSKAMAQGVTDKALDQTVRQTLTKHAIANALSARFGQLSRAPVAAMTFSKSAKGYVVKLTDMVVSTVMSEGLLALTDRDVRKQPGKKDSR